MQRPAFLKGLAEQGYVEGYNVTIDYYIAPNDSEVLLYAARAVASKPDLIVAFSSPPNVALKAIGTDIPIVFTLADPIAIGLVANYSRPGGNMTGTVQANPELVGKQFEILREIAPSVTRVVFFGQPDDPPYAATMAEAALSAKRLGLNLLTIEIKEGGDFVEPFERAAKGGAQAAVVMGVTYFNNNMQLMSELAVRYRLPTIGRGNQAQLGLLLGYGSNNADNAYRMAPYVAAILKGARPADLPIDLPKVFDFVINLKTARALGVDIPPSILLRATEVIE